MKRVIVTIVACLLICMAGCGQANPAEPVIEKEIIQLTKDNFYDYFFVEYETDNYSSDVSDILGYSFEEGTADCVINIGRKVPCTPMNVSARLNITTLSSFAWEESGKIVTVNIPVDGNVTKSVTIESDSTVKGLLEEPHFFVTLESVSGAVEVTK